MKIAAVADVDLSGAAAIVFQPFYFLQYLFYAGNRTLEQLSAKRSMTSLQANSRYHVVNCFVLFKNMWQAVSANLKSA